MGAWGHGSDANDDTYNALGIGIFDRVIGMDVEPDAAKVVIEEVLPCCEGIAYLGVVMWSLRQGLKLPIDTLDHTLADLRIELGRGLDTSWRDGGEGRLKAVAEEIKEVEAAIKADGVGQQVTKSQTVGDRFKEHVENED